MHGLCCVVPGCYVLFFIVVLRLPCELLRFPSQRTWYDTVAKKVVSSSVVKPGSSRFVVMSGVDMLSNDQVSTLGELGVFVATSGELLTRAVHVFANSGQHGIRTDLSNVV